MTRTSRLTAMIAVLMAIAPSVNAQQGVVWTNTTNATVNGATLTKTGGCDGCGDAGALAQHTIGTGGGWVRFSAVPATTSGLGLYAGLGPTLSTPPLSSEFDYALSFWDNGGWEVREGGDYRTDGTFSVGDVFEIRVESATGPVRYYRNGQLLYTSSILPAASAYRFGTTLFAISAAVSDASSSSGSNAEGATFDAISDRLPRAEPSLPAVGPAGFRFVDPAFSSRMMRVTDANTRPGSPNRSYHMPSNSHLMAWNATSTRFFVHGIDGTIVPYNFESATMTASRIAPTPTGQGGLTLPGVEPQFSLTNPDLIYLIAGPNLRTVQSYNFASETYSTIVDLDTVVPGLSGYPGGIMSGGPADEKLLAFFGGAQADQHYYVLWFDADNPSQRKLVDTVASTINGVATQVLLNFRVHAIQIDRSGRYVFIYPQSGDRQAPRYASPAYLWDTATDAITAMTTGGMDGSPNMVVEGHDAAGFGVYVNKDCCTSTTWDAAQWQFRYLNAPTVTRDLINPVLTPQEVLMADHSTWSNARPGVLEPFISSTYRYGNNTTPWRAWDDEIIAVQTSAPPGQGATVWRFAHHRSNFAHDSDPNDTYFWYSPIAIVSPDARWVLFTSNWEKTLGLDPADGMHRRDVFLVELKPLTGDGTGGAIQWTNLINASASGGTIQKTSGCGGCADSGGVSEQEISGVASVEFIPEVASGSALGLYAGLGPSFSTPPALAEFEYAFAIWANGGWEVREQGTHRAEGTFVAGDVFRVAVDDRGVVQYYKNELLVYTSQTAATMFPYRFGAALIDPTAVVRGAVLSAP